MSFELAFFSNCKLVTADDIQAAWRNSTEVNLDWETDTEFCNFVDALNSKLSEFDSVLHVNTGSAEQGFLKISLIGQKWQDAHHEIGGLLMMYNVICFDPQSGLATLELEPI